MEIQAMLRDLGERLGASASVKSVYGEPVTVGDRTVVPVAKVYYSFGAGGGSRRQEQEGSGGGGGGMAVGWPSGATSVLRCLRTDTRKQGDLGCYKDGL